MPSLHKRPESPYWVASYQDAKGRWLKKSTKTAERSLALKMALEWEKASKAGKAGRLVEAQARKVLSEIVEQATGSPIHFHTCQSWLTEWLAGKAGAIGGRSMLKYKAACEDFIEHLGDRATIPLNAVSVSDLRSYRDKLAKEGRTPNTVNQTIRKVLSMPFTAAHRLGYITVNPCAGVERLLDDADTEKDVFTPDQIAKLIQTAKGDWQGVILTGYFTGLRLIDIIEMRWESVDFDTGLLTVKTRKTGKIVVTPLTPELGDWLRSHPRGIGKAPVFPTLAGKSGAGKSGHSSQFKKIMAKAEIVGQTLRTREEGSKGRTTSSLSFHSLRHSFNSALANAGVSQETRQKLTGHASAAMNDRYTHHEVETLRAAVAKMPAIGGGGK